MHGAAQTAKAPPSRKREPRERAPCTQPGAEQPLGPGQQAHEDEPEDDQHETGDLLEQELVAQDRAADRPPRPRRARRRRP